jgi:quinoprotein glucose dehydrogenase
MKARLMGAAAAVGLMSVAAGAQRDEVPAGDWHGYGRDLGGARFSPLAELTPANVGRLARAWTFDMRGNATPAPRLMVSQMTPLAVAGIVYLATPYGSIVALDGDTGKLVWTYRLPDGEQVGGRGMQYWTGTLKIGPRIFYGTRSGRLEALDVRTGRPAAGFTPILLKSPDVMNGAASDGGYGINSSPIIFGSVVIAGSRVQESPALGPSGDVRGWDAETGRPLWTFHSIPQPGEAGFGTWEGDSWKRRSGVNVWNLMSVDKDLGIVYLPFGAPSYDRIGIDRKGDNLYSSSLVAVDARTGKYLWHFQTVHHDIWDHDVPGQPTLLEVKRGNRKIRAVAAVNKTGYIFLLDRRTGKPLYDVTERPVPPSTLAGEVASPTQPFPAAPPPISRQSMTLDDVTNQTPEQRQYCLDRIRDEKLTFARPFEPLRGDHPTIRFPGSGGGPNWGGGAFDRRLGLYIINTTEMASVEQMGLDPQGNWHNIGKGPGSFGVRGRAFLCHRPPWGLLSAVDVNSGRIAWQVPLGITDDAPLGKQLTGRPNLGGPILTATGLTFIGASDDSRFRAFETSTGRTLWEARLGASAHATPISYRGRSGRQYVATVVAGGSYLGSRATVSELVAFALPD